MTKWIALLLNVGLLLFIGVEVLDGGLPSRSHQPLFWVAVITPIFSILALGLQGRRSSGQ